MSCARRSDSAPDVPPPNTANSEKSWDERSDDDAIAKASWDELPGPALLSVCYSLLVDWPDTLRAVVSTIEACQAWAFCLRDSDELWRAIGDAAGLTECTSLATYVSRRAVHSCPPWGYLDGSIQPHQVRFAFVPGVAGQSVIKRSSSPDTSWAFSERGFSRASDRSVWFAVAVDCFFDELRVGFTDNPTALLTRSRGMTYDEPHAWLYSDGSHVRGIHGDGRRLTPYTPPFRSGDVVTVCIDFERDQVIASDCF